MWAPLVPVMAGVGGEIAGHMAYEDPGKAAQHYLKQIPGTMKPYYEPYIGAGREALGTLQQQYGSLLNDPTALMQALGSQYQQSPGYQWNVNQATNAANQAAAAGGMVGSPQEQQQLAGTVSGLANQDYYNFLNHALGLYGEGLSGMKDINQTGYMASTDLAQSIANALMAQSSAAYYGADANNQENQGFWGSLGSTLGGGLGGGASFLLGLL